LQAASPSEGLMEAQALKTCCKEWALKVAPRESCPTDQVGFEEEHACPTCQANYMVWFTRIGSPHTNSVQIVPVTIKPAEDLLQSSGYMQHFQNSSGTSTQPQNGL
jgi:hypothetical protein